MLSQASESPQPAQPAKNAACSTPPPPSPPTSTVSAPAATAGDDKPQAESEGAKSIRTLAVSASSTATAGDDKPQAESEEAKSFAESEEARRPHTLVPQTESEEAESMFALGTHAAENRDNGGAYDNFARSLLLARTVGLKSAILVRRSAILCSMLRWEEALADADECIRLRKSWACSYACQATALHGLGRAEEADQAKRLSGALAELKQDPKNEVCWVVQLKASTTISLRPHTLVPQK